MEDRLVAKIAKVLLGELHGITSIEWVKKHCPETYEEVYRCAKAIAAALKTEGETYE